MNFLDAGLLGILEGLTEFLPISSTFHLIWFSKILGIPQNDFIKLFEVFIQSGAILAVVFLYIKIFTHNINLIKKVIASFIPTVVIAGLMYKIIKNVFFESNVLMLTMFIGVGVFFIAYEIYLKKKGKVLSRTLEAFNYKQAIIIGLVQALAIVPGVSRAGAVIVGMMFLGFRRDEAAKYSFLLAVPTILAASALDAFEMRSLIFSSTPHILLLAVGFVTSFVSAYIVVKWFIHYLQKHSLAIFGWYRIIVGFLLILFGIK